MARFTHQTIMQTQTSLAEPAQPLTDAQVVDRVRAGQRELFEVLMRRHNQRVYRAVRSVLKDDPEVEDVMQQAYMLAFLHLNQFAGNAQFSTWLVRIAINEAFGRIRRARKLVLVPPEAHAEEEHARMSKQPEYPPTPEEHAARRELATLLESALDDLPEMYRGIVILREVEGLSTAETAEALATSEDVVKTRLHRGKALLHKRLTAMADHQLGQAFPFGARRCDRVVGAVMRWIALGGAIR